MKLNHIKNSFDNRKIEPSAGAWDQLVSRLDQEERKNKKPLIYWLSAVAAVLIFAMFVYPVVTNDIEAEEKINEVVVEDSQNKPASSYSKEQDMINPTKVIDSTLNTTISKEAFASVTNNKEAQTSISKSKKLETIDKKQKTDLIATTIEKPITNFKEEKLNSNSLLDDNSVNPELMNSIAQTTSKKLTAEEEMELLLKEAYKNLPETEYVEKSMNVDQLIREAEWDAETDRRNRVNDLIFDKLGKLKAEALTLIDGNN
ncbi:MAG: hypothetical protein ABF274_01945 [Nonlabens sp.]|uniref:hypothetical protein n=1 Tax=Nonlabens sp. TaxID=1888209 RepID=UPI0032194CD6